MRMLRIVGQVALALAGIAASVCLKLAGVLR